jgi:hypothetical protein
MTSPRGSRVCSAAALLGGLLLAIGVARDACAGEGPVPGLDPTRLGPQRTEALGRIIERLRHDGWTVIAIADDGIPTDWRSLNGGIHLRVMTMPPAVDLWVLPPDWLGIRPSSAGGGNQDVLRRGGLLFVMGPYEQCQAIRRPLHEMLADEALEPGPPAPHRPSPSRVAGFSAEQVAACDAAAHGLISRFCVGDREVADAVDSLGRLGIPAATVFTEAVRAEYWLTAHAGIRGLIGIGGDAAFTTLLEVLDHEETDRYRLILQQTAAQGVSMLAESGDGPLLLGCLLHRHHTSTIDSLVGALERIEYRPAGAAMLALWQERADPRAHGGYARALATLGHVAAIPGLRRVCGDAPITADSLFASRGGHDDLPELALLRLAGDWGEPVAGVRLMLLPFARTVTGTRCSIALLIENLGTADINATDYMPESGASTITIDGIAHRLEGGAFEGCFTVHPHATWLDACALGELITAPGTHRIRYNVGALASNEVTVEVLAQTAPEP